MNLMNLRKKILCLHLILIRLPNDHTMGTAKGNLTPKAYVAQNDYALGLMIDKISKVNFGKKA